MAPTLVSELSSEVGEDVQYIPVNVQSIKLRKHDADFGDVKVQLDEPGVNLFGRYYRIPNKFLPRLDPDVRNKVLQFFMGKAPEEDLMIQMEEDQFLRGVYRGDMPIIPKARVVEVLQRVFEPNDPVRRFEDDPTRLDVDVLSGELTANPHRKKGDVVRGGLRVVTHVAPWSGHGSLNPQISTLLERLECTNGNTKAEPTGTISLRGKNVDDIIEEMEQAAQEILGEIVPKRLTQFVSLSHEEVANPEQLLRQWGREHRIADSMLLKMIQRIPTLEQPVTRYDLLNLATSFQHEDIAGGPVRPTQFLRLQELGGSVAADQEIRCKSCGRTVDN
jgi:hypothetical protein